MQYIKMAIDNLDSILLDICSKIKEENVRFSNCEVTVKIDNEEYKFWVGN